MTASTIIALRSSADIGCARVRGGSSVLFVTRTL
jgi:hypothetical protein